MLDDDVLDYLWMCTNDEKLRQNFFFQIAKRLREANSDPEEFVQAAATQVLFHEADAIYRSVAHRAPAYAEELRLRGRSAAPE